MHHVSSESYSCPKARLRTATLKPSARINHFDVALPHPSLDMATAPPQGPPGHAHPHPHPHPPQPGQPGVRPPGMMMPPSPPPNPALQALLDAIPHTPVPFTIQDGPIPGTNPPQMTTMILCEAHKQVICQTCGVHFGSINYMFNFLKGAPAEAIPPPPNAPTQPQRAEAIKQAKEAGNVRGVWECCRSTELTSFRTLSSNSNMVKPLLYTRVRQIWHYQDHLGSHRQSREKRP
jgi:hypothetical protein